MIGRDHQITSAAIATTLIAVESFPVGFSWMLAPSVVVATAIGALIPDIDHQNSKASKFVKVPFYKVFQHRGLTHSLFGFAIFVGLLYVINQFGGPLLLGLNLKAPYYLRVLSVSLALGYFLHLLEDSWSQAGIRWLAPISQYDQYSYQHYHTLLRKPVRYHKVHHSRKKVPIRHWWGRGYQVGGRMEAILVVSFLLIALVSVLIHV